MGSRLFIESIASEEYLREGAVSEDIAYVERFSNCNRRREVLAWRAIVRRELGKQIAITYDEYGAPQVDVLDAHISISHSKERVAVLISDRVCAVDIEDALRDFRKVATKYLSDNEQAIAEKYGLYAEMWSAKEALYKYYIKGGLDLVKDIVIREYNPSKQQFAASICEGGAIAVNVLRENNYVMATID